MWENIAKDPITRNKVILYTDLRWTCCCVLENFIDSTCLSFTTDCMAVNQCGHTSDNSGKICKSMDVSKGHQLPLIMVQLATWSVDNLPHLPDTETQMICPGLLKDTDAQNFLLIAICMAMRQLSVLWAVMLHTWGLKNIAVRRDCWPFFVGQTITFHLIAPNQMVYICLQRLSQPGILIVSEDIHQNRTSPKKFFSSRSSCHFGAG